MLIDAHCHLYEFRNISKIIEEAKSESVLLILSNSVDSESFLKNLKIKEVFKKEVEIAIGLHPLMIYKNNLEDEIRFIEENVEKALAIGESGLDFIKGKSKELQEISFREQIKIAKENDKAIIVHSRGARKKCLEILEKEGAERALLHWFLADEKTMKKAFDSSYYVSVGPSILFSEYVAKIVEKIPLEHLLLETDAPVKYNGKEAKPSWISKVAKKVAKIKGIEEKELEKILEKNFNELFK